MENLKQILTKYADRKHLAGGKPDETNLSDTEVSQLQIQLQQLSKKNRGFFWISIIMIIIVFVVSLFVVLKFMSDPQQIKLIFGSTGISVMGLIAYANKLWKDIVRTDITIALVSAMDKKGINTILLIMIKKL